MENKNMTYQDLYRAATTWEARHIAQDYLLMYGAKEIASQLDIEKVSKFQVKEGGAPIASNDSCYVCGARAGNWTPDGRGFCGQHAGVMD
jgi:hypothetical protein